MKVIYNNKEVGDNKNNYNRLTDKPLINSVELVGNITLNDINVYSKEEVKKLISSARSVKVTLVLPSPLSPNTTYYIGPDMNGIYSVWLTDSADPINVFQIGTTSFGKYYSGEGINVTDPSNIVSVLVDSESVILNSEGLMEARPVFEKMQPFTGATASTDGSGGIVPAPISNTTDSNEFLFGDGTWKLLWDVIHPIGSLFMTDSTNNPSVFFPGTTWEQVSTGRALGTDAAGGGGTIDAGLPNIWGSFSIRPTFTTDYKANNGCGYSVASSKEVTWNLGPSGSGFNYQAGSALRRFNASNSNSIYGNSSTVQPPAISLLIYRRTA